MGLIKAIFFSDADCPIWEEGYHFVQDKCYYLDHAKYTYIKAAETCAEKFKNGGRLFEPKDEQTNNIVFKTIQKANEEAGVDYYSADFFLGIVADTYIRKIGNKTFGDLVIPTGKGPAMNNEVYNLGHIWDWDWAHSFALGFKVAYDFSRAIYIGEFQRNTASIGTITKKTPVSLAILRLLVQKCFFRVKSFLCVD